MEKRPLSFRTEKRKFLRYNYSLPLRYHTVKVSDAIDLYPEFVGAVSKNLSATGLLFTTYKKTAPRPSDLLIFNINYAKTVLDKEITDNALLVDDKLIGKVVRLEDNLDNTCDIAIVFIKKSHFILKHIENIMRIYVNPKPPC